MNDRQTLIAHIFLHAKRNPNKKAIIFENQNISYAKLWAKILSAANYLSDLSISQGDRIILTASQSPSFIYGYFGTHLIGAVAVPIDPKIPKTIVDFIIKMVSPKKIFLADQIDNLDIDKAKKIKKIDFPKLKQVSDIIFTSGTTGNPKGVVLTQKNILAQATNINQFIGNKPNDKEVVPLPLSHSFGLGRLRCNLLKGSTLILCNGFLNPLKIFELLEKHKATGFSSVP